MAPTVGELDDYRWLTSDQAAPYLEAAAQADRSLTSLASLLRRDLSASRAHLVLEQVELRRRAKEKFSTAERMFFTKKALEQATDEAIAKYKASRLPRGVIGHDFCCGIGGDLLQLAARAEQAIGVDLDPVTAYLAETNCRTAGLNHVRVISGDVRDFPPAADGWWHLDPDRRWNRARASQIEHYSPGDEVWRAWFDRCPQGMIKLAPAARVSPWQAAGFYCEWIETRGECRQQLLLKACDGAAGKRSAVLLGGGGEVLGRVIGDEAPLPAAANCVLRYLFEPRPCVLAAGLAPSLAGQWELAPVSAGSVYWTSDQCVTSPMMAAFEVLLEAPLDLKRWKAILKHRRLGRLEVKCRGVNIDPEQLLRRLKPEGDQSGVLAVVRQPAGMRAILARRLPAP